MKAVGLLKNLDTSPELAEVKVVYKTKQRPSVKVSCSKDAYNILIELFDQDTIEYQENFYMLLLNRANYVLGWVRLSTGGTSGTVVDVKIVFTVALKTNASAIILCHNHPSQSNRPSVHDAKLTQNISQAGKIIDIQLLDHLIISLDNGYYSFADEGLI